MLTEQHVYQSTNMLISTLPHRRLCLIKACSHSKAHGKLTTRQLKVKQYHMTAKFNCSAAPQKSQVPYQRITASTYAPVTQQFNRCATVTGKLFTLYINKTVSNWAFGTWQLKDIKTNRLNHTSINVLNKNESFHQQRFYKQQLRWQLTQGINFTA